MVLMEKQLSMSDLEQSEEMIPTGLGTNSQNLHGDFDEKNENNLVE